MQLPRLFDIDPISYARIGNMGKNDPQRNDAAYVNDRMMVINPVAKATHICKTYMAAQIAKNRIKFRMPPERKIHPLKKNQKASACSNYIIILNCVDCTQMIFVLYAPVLFLASNFKSSYLPVLHLRRSYIII